MHSSPCPILFFNKDSSTSQARLKRKQSQTEGKDTRTRKTIKERKGAMRAENNTTRTRVLVLQAQYFAGVVLDLGADADFDLCCQLCGGGA